MVDPHDVRSGRRDRSRPANRWLGGVLAGALLFLAPWAAAPGAAADPVPVPVPLPVPVPDLVGITGYDFETEAPARVVVGSARNNLRLSYTAGEGLEDGLIVLSVPRPAWRTPLHPGDKLFDDGSSDGSVVARPVETLFPAVTGECTVPAEPFVVTRPTEWLAVLPRVDCQPGQQLTVRVFGVRAPVLTGRYPIPVSVYDADGPRTDRQLRLPVVEAPRTALTLDVPATVTLQHPTSVVVRALRPDGRLDRSYRGKVVIEDPAEQACPPVAVVDLAAADGGVKAVSIELQRPGARHLTVRDAGRGALPGRSRAYTEVTPDDYQDKTCSVSYH